MGADLCLFCINTPKGKKPNYKRARKFISSFTSKSLTEHPGLDELGNIGCDDFIIYKNADDYEGVADAAGVKKAARAWLKEVEESFDCARDCTVFETATETIWITGGMTWGDDPRETSRVLSNLDALGVVAHLFYDAPSAETPTDHIVTHWTCDDEDCSEHGKVVDVPVSQWHGDFGSPICPECGEDLSQANTATVT